MRNNSTAPESYSDSAPITNSLTSSAFIDSSPFILPSQETDQKLKLDVNLLRGIKDIINTCTHNDSIDEEILEKLKAYRKKCFEMMSAFRGYNQKDFTRHPIAPHECHEISINQLEKIEEYLNFQIQKHSALKSLEGIINPERERRLEEYRRKIHLNSESFYEIMKSIPSDSGSRVSATNNRGNPTWSITLKKPYKSIKSGFKWEIPSCSIITGKNGVGKTQLFELIQKQYPNITHKIDPSFLANIAHIYHNKHGDRLQLTQNIQTTELSQIESYARGNIFDTFTPFGEGGFKTMLNYYWHDFLNNLNSKNKPESGFIWEIINRLLGEYNLGFQIEFKPNLTEKFQIFFKKNGVEIELSDLSSGELALFSIISWLAVLERDGSTIKKACILFDEADIHFHPEFSKKFFEFIKKLTSDKSADIRVLMTTHNPATIALLDKSIPIYIMERDAYNNAKLTQAITKRQAISSLSSGLVTVVNDINYVLVENEDDAQFYSIVYQKFLASSFLSSHSTRLIFTPVGVKIVETDNLQKLGELASSIKVESEEEKTKLDEMKTLLAEIRKNNDIGGGCSQIEKRIKLKECNQKFDSRGIITQPVKKGSSSHQPEMIWGLLDRDKNRISKNTIHAIDVYSIENYLCMPLNLLYIINSQNKNQDPVQNKIIADLEKSLEIETDKQKSELQRLLSFASTYILNYLRQKISYHLNNQMEKENITKLNKCLQSTSSRVLCLANNLNLDCPELFIEGLPGGKNGHKLFNCLGFLIFDGQDGYKERMRSSAFNALEKIPATLLPNGLLNVMKNLSSCESIRAKVGDKRKATVEISSKNTAINFNNIEQTRSM